MRWEPAASEKPQTAKHRLPWSGRTLMVLLPLHVVAFSVLYFAVVDIVRQELRAVRRSDARTIMRSAVNSLHPLMAASNHEKIAAGIRELMARNATVQLGIFDALGRPVAGGVAPDPGVVTFLSGRANEYFRLLHPDGRDLLLGRLRILPDQGCTKCHPAGRTLGVAEIRLDLTDEIRDIRARIRIKAAMLVLGFLVLVALMNVLSIRTARRTLNLFRSDALPDGAVASRLPLMLDPVSGKLFRALADELRRQRHREQEVSTRMQHADRLASLGQLAAGMAHEIKNPLAGIRGALELIRDEGADERLRKLYEQMLAEIDRINRTINSLLQFARPTATERQPTPIEPLIAETVIMLRPTLQRRSIELSDDIEAGIGSIEIDATQIRQVIVNLINNAAESITGEGTITITGRRLPDGLGVMLAVADTGHGIPDEVKARIFDPFYTTKFTGTGLGLAVVERLVRQHGGRIEVASTPGEGSTFFVILPNGGDPDLSEER